MKNIFLLSMIFFLCACASIFKGTRDEIEIQTANPNARIYINDAYYGNGKVNTSFSKNEEYEITVHEKGCPSKNIHVGKHFDPVTLLGAFWDFGIISILIVDNMTGAIKDFDQNNFLIHSACD